MGFIRSLVSRRADPTERLGWSTLIEDGCEATDGKPTMSALHPRALFHRRNRRPTVIRITSNPLIQAVPSPIPTPELSAKPSFQDPFDDRYGMTWQDPFSDTFGVDPSTSKPKIDTYFDIYNDDSTGRTPLRTESTLMAKPPQGLQSYAPSTLPPKSKFERCQSSFAICKNKLYQQFDPKTVWSMIDIREIFWPFTWKKYLVLTIVAMLIATVVVSEHFFKWIEKSMEITRSNMLPVLILVIGLEPLMIIVILALAKIPDLDHADAVPSNPAAENDLTTQMAALEKKVQIEENPHSTALVIPCHNSDHVAMKRVLESAYPHFRPCDIFIVDNGRSMYPKTSDFRDFIREQHPDINYIWSPIGSKNAAQLVGSMAARDHEFIMTVDDDVCIPTNFRPPLDLIDDKTKGVAFPLKATNADGKVPLFLVAWQDCEYRMAGLTKLAESQICGVLFPHGAGWFCHRETLIDLISNYHSIDFIAEDVNTGLSMQRMKKLIAFDARCILETEVPTTFFGAGLNWYHQRVRSWEMGRHGRTFAFINRLLFSLNGQTTPWGIFAQKFIYVYNIASNIVDWVRVPVLVTMGGNGQYWFQAGLLTLVSVLPLMWFRFVACRHRPDLRPTFGGSLTIPIYKQLYALVSIIGATRSVVFYCGGHQKPKPVKQMVEDGDERCLWLDPRFETNPAFLADEAEERTRKEKMQEYSSTESDEHKDANLIVVSEVPASSWSDLPNSSWSHSQAQTLYSDPTPAMSTQSLDCIQPIPPGLL